MAKRKGVNKSDKIREFLKANPDATPKTIIEELKKKGIKVSQALVSNIKYRNKNGVVGKRGRRGRPRKSDLSVGDLLELKGLVEQMGGVPAVRAGLEALEKLR